MPKLSAETYRQRAQRLREIAEGYIGSIREAFLDIAHQYEQLAAWVDGRDGGFS